MEKRYSGIRYGEKPKNDNIVFGFHPVKEALIAKKAIDKILLQKTSSNDLSFIIQECKEMEIPFQFVPIEKLNRITAKNHQGVIAFVSPVHFSKIENIIPEVYEKGEVPLVVILDRVTDVRNFGAICRSAECAGAHAVIIPEKGAAQVNEDALKTSAGALMHLPICKEYNLKNTIQFLKDSGLKIVSCTEKTDKSLFEENLNEPLCIIMGSEEEGISAEYLKLSDKKVKIPMFGKIGSLNVSVATSVILYECVRQRKF
ncbi:MAG: 23S rRNA (guanosine(2251)-2'-O)-methyltransferase RlmB [Cytophagales bacterium]